MNGRRVGALATLIVLLLLASAAVLLTGVAEEERGASKAEASPPTSSSPGHGPIPGHSLVAAARVTRVPVYPAPDAPRPTL